jgi:hypothetical protein
MYRSMYPPWHWLEVSGHRHPSCLTSGTQWIGGWLGPRAGLDGVERRNKSCPTGIQVPIPRPSSSLPVAALTVPLITEIDKRINKFL